MTVVYLVVGQCEGLNEGYTDTALTFFFMFNFNLYFLRMKQEKEENHLYVPPEVTILEVQVEQGFAASPAGGNTSPWEPDDGQWQ